jgi:hypothetical protein
MLIELLEEVPHAPTVRATVLIESGLNDLLVSLGLVASSLTQDRIAEVEGVLDILPGILSKSLARLVDTWDKVESCSTNVRSQVLRKL